LFSVPFPDDFSGCSFPFFFKFPLGEASNPLSLDFFFFSSLFDGQSPFDQWITDCSLPSPFTEKIHRGLLPLFWTFPVALTTVLLVFLVFSMFLFAGQMLYSPSLVLPCDDSYFFRPRRTTGPQALAF